MLPLLKLAWTYRKFIAYGLAVLAAALMLWRITEWRAGYIEREKLEISLKSAEANLANMAKASERALKEQQDRAAKAEARNAGIEADYLAKLNASAGDRDRIYGLLVQARNQVRASAAREATSATIAATAGEARIAERIDRAVAGAVAESKLNADQLDALIAVVKPLL